jgi:hypothetical protein
MQHPTMTAVEKCKECCCRLDVVMMMMLACSAADTAKQQNECAGASWQNGILMVMMIDGENRSIYTKSNVTFTMVHSSKIC